MRLAFTDLLFSWPPHGGACIDVYHTVAGLQTLGHEVRLFVAAYGPARERGKVDPAQLPFPCTSIEFLPGEFTARDVPARFRRAVDDWRPDAVFVGDAFFLKPYLIEVLAHYPCVGRFYAYEASCPRDFRRFLRGQPCPLDYLNTPNACRRCALEGMRAEIQAWRLSSWTQEYLAAQAYLPGYYKRLTRALSQLKAVIVYNEIQQALLPGYNGHIHVVPGGVDLEQFTPTPLPTRGVAERKVVLMAGRAEDPAKGLGVLRQAADRLSQERGDFEVWATHPDPALNSPHFRAVGWHDPAGLRRLYAQADICVVPSVWDEPFGMVAVEAMAMVRPVCAARVGGLGDIVRPGETGFLFERGDTEGLAEALSRLLDDPELCRQMGEAGRRRAEAVYDWKQVIARHYPAVLEDLAR